MRWIISFILLVFCFSFSNELLAQQNQKRRWIETERLKGKKNRQVDFTDTFYLQIGRSREIMMRRGGFMYKGTLGKKTLTFIDRVYDVIQNDSSKIVLKDEDKILHVFVPDKIDSSAIDATQKMQENTVPETAATNINRSELNGMWTAYKRSMRNGGPMPNINFKTLIKSIRISDSLDEDNCWGKIYNNAGQQAKSLAKITSINLPKIIYTNNDGASFTLTILKLSERELILEDEQHLIYFFLKETE